MRKQSEHCEKLLQYIEQQAMRKLKELGEQESMVLMGNVSYSLLSSAE